MGYDIQYKYPASISPAEKDYSYYAHANPIFHKLKLLKIHEIIKFYIATFMYQYMQGMLSNAFDSFFIATNSTHDYITRLA